MIRDEEIALTSDVARAVAEELGISKKMASHHIDFLAHWIKKLSKNPQILNIQIPYLGNMFLNISKVKREYDFFSELSEEEMSKSWSNRLELHRLRLEEFNRQFPNLEGYSRHKKKTKIMNSWFTKGMSLKELEEWQNK